eukprot:scaffold2188_cov388-Prasinococcus_capsulatus_cf.AAC.12
MERQFAKFQRVQHHVQIMALGITTYIAGTYCEESMIEGLSDNILGGLDVLGYDRNLIMHQGEFDVRGEELVMELPAGFTRNKTGDSTLSALSLRKAPLLTEDPVAGLGDVYRMDAKTWRELPANVTRPKHSSCAVVGNSGTMLHAHYGMRIDASDAVFRFNQAPRVGEEPSGHNGIQGVLTYLERLCKNRSVKLATSLAGRSARGRTLVLAESGYRFLAV